MHQNWRLNERMYGGLTGLNKKETVAKYGDEQVHACRPAHNCHHCHLTMIVPVPDTALVPHPTPRLHHSQVKKWRRSYSIPPPPIETASEYWPGNDNKCERASRQHEILPWPSSSASQPQPSPHDCHRPGTRISPRTRSHSPSASRTRSATVFHLWMERSPSHPHTLTPSRPHTLTLTPSPSPHPGRPPSRSWSRRW